MCKVIEVENNIVCEISGKPIDHVDMWGMSCEDECGILERQAFVVLNEDGSVNEEKTWRNFLETALP